jgi:integration host factor subunit beta
MKRSELVRRLAGRFPALQPRDAYSAVNLICEAMAQVLRDGRRIEIRGFGSFAVNYRKARLNRNPRTGERVQVPPKHVPHFKTGKELRKMVAQGPRQQESLSRL